MSRPAEATRPRSCVTCGREREFPSDKAPWRFICEVCKPWVEVNGKGGGLNVIKSGPPGKEQEHHFDIQEIVYSMTVGNLSSGILLKIIGGNMNGSDLDIRAEKVNRPFEGLGTEVGTMRKSLLSEQETWQEKVVREAEERRREALAKAMPQQEFVPKVKIGERGKRWIGYYFWTVTLTGLGVHAILFLKAANWIWERFGATLATVRGSGL